MSEKLQELERNCAQTNTQMKDKHLQTHMDNPRGSYVCVTRIQTNPCGLSDTN